MIVTDKWKGSVSKKTYTSTGKEPPTLDVGEKEYAYWMLAGRIEDRFGGAPATAMDIYNEVTGPLGLSLSDTITLIKSAKGMGYLE